MNWSLLPVDLGRWDQAAGGDVLGVCVWSDVRPLRGAAGLCDWRLCGALSQRLHEGAFAGARGDTLQLPTQRLPWRSVLAIGLGELQRFSEDTYLAALEVAFETARAQGAREAALSLPGRDLERMAPARAAVLLRAAIAAHEHIATLTIVDSPAALKEISATLGLDGRRVHATGR